MIRKKGAVMNIAENLGNFKFNPNPSAFMQGYFQSAMLAGAYSGYNPIVMNFAGWMGGISNIWMPKE